MNNAVLFVVGKNLISRRIQAHTQQVGIEREKLASHVAYKFSYDPLVNFHSKMKDPYTGQKYGAGIYVIESHFHSGVAVFPYLTWLKMNKNSDINEVVDDSYKLDAMLSFIGEKYAVKDILKIKLNSDLALFKKNIVLKIIGYPVLWSWKLIESLIFQEDEDGIYCSELLLKANDTISNKLFKKPFESFPSDLQKYYLEREKEVVA
jgi:hypothetical protein